ncbi:hypothetical protein [Flavobacterium terrisoli]|uniref:hypothetical protein n=1 Tax=Flavobacterium terrisoli TaxID=3242195 RepID=UPI002543F648|nr:hypothetical protein [Flavobacterium buctense]
MKNIFCLSFLLLSCIGFSQNPTSFVLGKANRPFSSNVSVLSLKDFSFVVNLSDKRSYADKYFLSVYNPMTQMNDNYVKVNNQYYQTNNKSFPIYNFNGMKTDSLNPNGVSDFGSAIASGILNLFFEKF